MKAAIKREESKVCLGYPEREQSRLKVKNEEWKVEIIFERYLGVLPICVCAVEGAKRNVFFV